MISRYFLIGLRKAILIIAFLFIIPNPLLSQESIFKERYLWVVRTSMVSKESIEKMVQYAVINRFNNIVVQVRGRGDAVYNSNGNLLGIYLSNGFYSFKRYNSFLSHV